MTSPKSHAARILGLRIHVLCYAVLNVVQVLVWWFFTPEQHFWPIWSLVAWGLGLAFHVWAVTRPVRA
ncbi:2TM domain-containing protein [Catenuloplanes nepalensis]|uniref:2TM domain-containing protein n=1 Tax=Catenuloplanes nepalensis TaxID=587533 RepID=UPI0027D7AB4D|nr:2TM domain-containing protein [Catenuloplanes nepalensis]